MRGEHVSYHRYILIYVFDFFLKVLNDYEDDGDESVRLNNINIYDTPSLSSIFITINLCN